MGFDPSRFFSVPLLDLGSVGQSEMAGIFVPEPEIGRKKSGVTNQFFADAEDYHERYCDVPHFRNLIKEALDRVGWPSDGAVVLDIGSGSGNSVLPCLDLLETALIVAIDISPKLLKILQRTLISNQRNESRVALVCMDATRSPFNTSCFDLVIGAAILHHLIDPTAALLTASKVLKPGGHAIFFEPFENGNAILYLAYKEIVKRAESGARIDSSALHAL